MALLYPGPDHHHLLPGSSTLFPTGFLTFPWLFNSLSKAVQVILEQLTEAIPQHNPPLLLLALGLTCKQPMMSGQTQITCPAFTSTTPCYVPFAQELSQPEVSLMVGPLSFLFPLMNPVSFINSHTVNSFLRFESQIKAHLQRPHHHH
jgi:hypothetical protein